MSSPLESSFEPFRPEAEDEDTWMDEDYHMGSPPRPTPLPLPEPMPPLPPVPQPTHAVTLRAPAAQTLSYWPAPPPPDVRYIDPFLVAQVARLRRVANGSESLTPPVQTKLPILQQPYCPPRFQNQQLQLQFQKQTPLAQAQRPDKREVLAQFGPGNYEEEDAYSFDDDSEEVLALQRETALSQSWNNHVREWTS